MQDTEHDMSPEEATAAAQAALHGGTPADARAQATSALERHGPDPELYTLLGRAHAAENEDDHDDEAERVYRQGLEAFPDHLDLLAAYAELCLESDALDRPGRHARGPALVARIVELAPGSRQALHVDRHARGELMVLPGAGPLPTATAAHIQRHDVRAALADAPDLDEAARLAEEQAARYPYDARLAVRAETLTALTRPGRRLFLAHVRAPLASLLIVTAIAATLTITRAAFHLPGWMSLIAVLLYGPGLALISLERHAHARGLARLLPPPDEADLPESPLPPPPPVSSRQFAVNLAVLCVMVCSAASPLLWPSPPEDTDYPRYTVTPPATLLGAPCSPPPTRTRSRWGRRRSATRSRTSTEPRRICPASAVNPSRSSSAAPATCATQRRMRSRSTNKGSPNRNPPSMPPGTLVPATAADGCTASRTPPTWRPRAHTRRAVGPTGAASGPSS